MGEIHDRPTSPPPLPDAAAVTMGGVDGNRRPRGFAAIDPALVSQIASKGGRAAHAAGTAHEFTSEEAKIAGRKGSLTSGETRRAQKTARELAAQGKAEDLGTLVGTPSVGSSLNTSKNGDSK